MSIATLHTIYSAYVNNQLTLEEFEGRLVPLLPSIFESSDPHANKLAGIAELGLSEIDSGILTEDGFRTRLREALSDSPSRVQISEADPEEYRF